MATTFENSSPAGGPAQHPSSDQAEIRYPVTFTGRGGEYFKIWIVNVLLSAITLYIYSAWAKVRNKRYFYGNTVVDNSSFEYHATGGQIFKGRVIAIIALILVSFAGAFSPLLSTLLKILLILIIPWVVWRTIIFNARMSSYRNIRYGFTKRAGPLYWAMIKPIILPGLMIAGPYLGLAFAASLAHEGLDTLAGFYDDISESVAWVPVLILLAIPFLIAIPWLHRNLSHYALNGYRYGTSLFSADLSLRKYFLIYFFTLLISVVPLVIILGVISGGIAAGSLMPGGLESITDAFDPESPFFALAIALSVLAYLLYLFLSIIPAAYMRCKIRNYRYAQTVVGNQVRAESSIKTWPLTFLLFTNVLLLIVTLGFALPWTRVRSARYMAKHTVVISKGTLEHFVGVEEKRVSSLGDEFGEAFDIDFEIGV